MLLLSKQGTFCERIVPFTLVRPKEGAFVCTQTIIGVQTLQSKRYCDKHIEYVMLQCRPFYLPKEFTSVVITAVYVPTHANARLAMQKLHHTISKHLLAHPDSIVITAVDFNNTNLKSVQRDRDGKDHSNLLHKLE